MYTALYIAGDRRIKSDTERRHSTDVVQFPRALSNVIHIYYQQCGKHDETTHYLMNVVGLCGALLLGCLCDDIVFG